MKLLFLGDIFFSPNKKNKTMKISDKLEGIFEDKDKICINLEGPVINDNDGKIEKIGPNIYQDKERILKFLERKNILCNLANNHIMDYGKKGMEETISNIKNECFGAGNYEDAYRPYIYEKEGVKVGFISIAEAGFGVAKYPDEFGYAWFNSEKNFENIRKLKEICDYVFVVCHAGLEDVEIPLREIRKLYKSYVDFGADMVIAHHPHMIQGKEVYHGKEIYYSLGNCMFDNTDGNGEYNGNSIGVEVNIIQNDLNTSVISLEYKDGILDLCKKSEEIFARTIKRLELVSYDEEIDKICLEYYQKYYRNYYRSVFGKRNRLYNMYIAIMYLFGADKYSDIMLYHNLEIETHYWTTKRGLEVYRKDEQKR